MSIDQLEPFFQFLEQHSQWIAASIVLVAFLESLALVGIILPGVVLLFGLAVLAAKSGFSLEAVLLFAYLGAIAGDGISYLLGRHYSQRIPSMWPIKNNPHWLDNGYSFFDRYGGLSIVIGRFVGPLRPIVPMVAGMLKMSALKFYSINLISAIGWAFVYILPGYLVGAALDQDNQHAKDIMVLLAIWLSGGIFIWWTLQKINKQMFFSTSCFALALVFYYLPSSLLTDWGLINQQITRLSRDLLLNMPNGSLDLIWFLLPLFSHSFLLYFHSGVIKHRLIEASFFWLSVILLISLTSRPTFVLCTVVSIAILRQALLLRHQLPRFNTLFSNSVYRDLLFPGLPVVMLYSMHASQSLTINHAISSFFISMLIASHTPAYSEKFAPA